MDELPIVEGFHKCGNLEVIVKSQGHTIEEVVLAFECALRGASYCFDGHFELTED
jgi:hypothetical protein